MTSSGWQNVAAPMPLKAAITILRRRTPAAAVMVGVLVASERVGVLLQHSQQKKAQDREVIFGDGRPRHFLFCIFCPPALFPSPPPARPPLGNLIEMISQTTHFYFLILSSLLPIVPCHIRPPAASPSWRPCCSYFIKIECASIDDAPSIMTQTRNFPVAT